MLARLCAFGCPTEKVLAKDGLSLEVQEGYRQTWHLLHFLKVTLPLIYKGCEEGKRKMYFLVNIQ